VDEAAEDGNEAEECDELSEPLDMLRPEVPRAMIRLSVSANHGSQWFTYFPTLVHTSSHIFLR
jgi:hypothetical protein